MNNPTQFTILIEYSGNPTVYDTFDSRKEAEVAAQELRDSTPPNDGKAPRMTAWIVETKEQQTCANT